MKSNIIIFLLVLLLSVLQIFCGDSKKDNIKLKEDSIETARKMKEDSIETARKTEKELDSLNEEKTKNQILNFAKKYDAQIGFDTIDLRFSIDCESIKIGKEHPILLKSVNIIDISKKDNSFYLYIQLLYIQFRDIYLFLKCTEEQEKELYVFEKRKLEMKNNLAFIITLDMLKKIKLTISSDIEDPQSEDEYSYIIINNPNAFIGKGTLIDFLKY